MIRFLLCAVVALALAAPSVAATIQCEVPNPYITRATELCEELRLRLRVRSADWSNKVCADEILRVGFRTVDASSTEKDAKATIRAAKEAALSSFDTNFPISAVQSTCGDSIADAEFGEQCDNGPANDDGAGSGGCDSDCQLIP